MSFERTSDSLVDTGERARRFLKDREDRKNGILRNTRLILAFRRTDPASLAGLLAQNCVKRGKRFLNRHAPLGWWRNCLNLTTCRVHINRSEETPLALAFEFDPRMTDEFGYVQDYIVARKLGLQIYSPKTGRLGFSSGPLSSGYRPFESRYPDVVITTKRLDAAWAYMLMNPGGEMLCQYRHEPTRYMQRFIKELLSRHRRNWLSRLFKPKNRMDDLLPAW